MRHHPGRCLQWLGRLGNDHCNQSASGEIDQELHQRDDPRRGNSRLRLSIIAPADTALTNFSITDNLPLGVSVSNSSGPTFTGCGAAATHSHRANWSYLNKPVAPELSSRTDMHSRCLGDQQHPGHGDEYCHTGKYHQHPGTHDHGECHSQPECYDSLGEQSILPTHGQSQWTIHADDFPGKHQFLSFGQCLPH